MARAAHAASLHEAMYLRLSILSGHTSTYMQDMGTRFEGVLLELEATGGGPTTRGRVLRKRGISTKGEWNKFNSMFKESWKRKAPTSGKAEYKRELLETKLRHIQVSTRPSQTKGKVSGVGGEEERLMTVLYYDLVEKSNHKSKGETDDDDDDESD